MAASAALLLGPVDVETVQQLRVQGGLFHGAWVAEIEGNVTDPWAALSRLRGAQGGNAEVLRAYARFLRAVMMLKWLSWLTFRLQMGKLSSLTFVSRLCPAHPMPAHRSMTLACASTDSSYCL
jgi:hypothetical protein